MTSIPVNPKIPKGIDSLPSAQIPEQWDKNWFLKFLHTWLRAADVRNGIGIGITISGNGTTPVTLALTGSVSGTVPLAKLTPTGTTGSLIFTNGVLTKIVSPT